MQGTDLVLRAVQPHLLVQGIQRRAKGALVTRLPSRLAVHAVRMQQELRPHLPGPMGGPGSEPGSREPQVQGTDLVLRAVQSHLLVQRLQCRGQGALVTHLPGRLAVLGVVLLPHAAQQ